MVKQEDVDCEDHFKANFSRLSSGEFAVKLPIKKSLEILGDSYTQAYRRFLNLERKLERRPQLKAQYVSFIRVESELLSRCRYFLPHHCVFKEDSTTTKLRVVFVGSATTSTGFSLNEVLMAGPTIQPKLLHTLLRFRTFLIALTGDICKMYRCVRVSEPDNYLQCILWRDSPHEDVKAFKLDTVTYGTKPASYLAIRSMLQLAEEERTAFPIGSEVLTSNFYVDDLMTGGGSVEEVREKMRQTSQLLARGRFPIRKWCSNVPGVLEGIPDKDKETLLRFDDGTDFTKALGLVLTVPKLELCGADLLSQLISEIQKLKLFTGSFYCWSDSTTALSWVRHDSSSFNVFVANRVSAIQERTAQMEWHYVPIAQNPADILSRGASPSELLESHLWAHGPPFLQDEQPLWPAASIQSAPTLELRKRVLIAVCPFVDLSDGRKFSNSFGKIQRTFGYVFKFLQRKRSSGLTVADIVGGTRILLRSIQRVHLWPDYKTLRDEQQVQSSSSISSLAPFLDDHGLLRVGGRLENSSLDFNARHPVILPRRHPVTSAVIVHVHEQNLHAGPRSLLALIRHEYWPIGGRKTVASVVNRCTRCFKAKPRLLQHIMADLPKDRVNASYVFAVTGVDFCGPFFFKSEVRTRPPIKCYICLFICFATKAVHLELVQDLSTPAFISALKRFILTRGRPREIWSDNATNFVGAKNELADLKKLFLAERHMKEVQEFCVADHIEWRFIPPRSPHFGGLWEAAVKTAKHHFYRSASSSLLCFDDLRTLVCHITAIINSRPLLPISEHPDDLDMLTPAHFLGTAPIRTFAEPDVTGLNFNRLDRWQQVNFLQQTFWSRWREEYLTLLQERAKWRTKQPNLSVGDVVPRTAPIRTFAEPDVTGLNFNRLDRWQQVNFLQQTFWSRWREEHRTLLQERAKWRTKQPNLSVGDVVLVKNENLPPLKWPLGRVTKLIAGRDGVSRLSYKVAEGRAELPAEAGSSGLARGKKDAGRESKNGVRGLATTTTTQDLANDDDGILPAEDFPNTEATENQRDNTKPGARGRLLAATRQEKFGNSAATRSQHRHAQITRRENRQPRDHVSRSVVAAATPENTLAHVWERDSK
ncbi:uncharacterized protein LOC121404670 [Drosophila obscura]|uniref:uncharacterized protein LOC121404670 n=1 Tax=Drosophila obscura TaxID=7282 RepID=UPI001BB11141|nr:uncharacterized protein LOC121404670 [Drosophila obscura]